MFIKPSFEKSLIVEQFQGNYLKQSESVMRVSTVRGLATKVLKCDNVN